MMRRKASGNREQQRFSLRKVSGHLTSVLIGGHDFWGLNVGDSEGPRGGQPIGQCQ